MYLSGRQSRLLGLALGWSPWGGSVAVPEGIGHLQLESIL